VERRASAAPLAAVAFIGVALGLLDGAGALLMLSPFLSLVLPLLAGLDPVTPSVECLLAWFRLRARRGAGRSAAALPEACRRIQSLLTVGACGSRGPPVRFVR